MAEDKGDCVEAVHLLYHYLDGELTVERRVLIRQHLDDCPPCGQAFDFEAELRQHGLPLYSLETYTPLQAWQALGQPTIAINAKGQVANSATSAAEFPETRRGHTSETIGPSTDAPTIGHLPQGNLVMLRTRLGQAGVQILGAKLGSSVVLGAACCRARRTLCFPNLWWARTGRRGFACTCGVARQIPNGTRKLQPG